MSTLHIVRGKPGSGKSTFARDHFPGVLHLENDMFHMHDGAYDWSSSSMHDAVQWCNTMVETALKNSVDVVVANTFTKCKYIDFYRKLAEKWYAKFKVWRCTGNFKNVHGLTDSMVKRFEDSMEDWPGETVVQPEQIISMPCEVFDLASNEVYGKFSDIEHADMFIAGMDDDLACQVQIRMVAA